MTLRYFRCQFEYHTRPWFRKGRIQTEYVVFSARDMSEAMRAGRDYGEERYHRCRWQLCCCVEIEAPKPQEPMRCPSLTPA